MLSFVNFFPVKFDRSDVKAGVCLHENIFTDSHFDVTSVSFNRKKIYEDEIFSCDRLHFFLRRIQRLYRYLKSPRCFIHFNIKK